MAKSLESYREPAEIQSSTGGNEFITQEKSGTTTTASLGPTFRSTKPVKNGKHKAWKGHSLVARQTGKTGETGKTGKTGEKPHNATIISQKNDGSSDANMTKL